MVFVLTQSQSQAALQQGMAAAVLVLEQKLDMLQQQLHTMREDNQQGHEQTMRMVSTTTCAMDLGAVADAGRVLLAGLPLHDGALFAAAASPALCLLVQVLTGLPHVTVRSVLPQLLLMLQGHPYLQQDRWRQQQQQHREQARLGRPSARLLTEGGCCLPGWG